MEQAHGIQGDIRRVLSLAEMMFKFPEARSCLKEQRRLFEVMARNLPGKFKPGHPQLAQLDLRDDELSQKSGALEAVSRRPPSTWRRRESFWTASTRASISAEPSDERCCGSTGAAAVAFFADESSVVGWKTLNALLEERLAACELP